MFKDLFKFVVFVVLMFIALVLCEVLLTQADPAFGIVSSEDIAWLRSGVLHSDIFVKSNKPETEVRYVNRDCIAIDACGNTLTLKYADRVNYVPGSVDSDDFVEIISGDSSYLLPRQYLRSTVPPKKGRKFVGKFQLTAYAHTGNRCANGLYPRRNRTVAAHTKDFPLGSVIYIEGYGTYVVEDRGGFPRGVIDIYMHNHKECVKFGRRSTNVYLITLGNNKRYKPETAMPKQK